MEDIVGKKILIHGYKHNGKIHRCWSKGLVLQETDDHYIVINNRTLVTESDGRMWHTREPSGKRSYPLVLHQGCGRIL